LSLQTKLFGLFLTVAVVPVAGLGLLGAEFLPYLSGHGKLIYLAIIVLAILSSGLLSYFSSRMIARPVGELADRAARIADGDYGTHIDVDTKDELGQIAKVFNQLSEKLRMESALALDSREQLRRTQIRFGETLRSTHDLERMLEVVLDIGMETVRAGRGALMLVEPPGVLSLKIGRNLGEGGFMLEVGKGIAGFVAETGKAVRLPNGPESPSAGEGEPEFTNMLAAPLLSSDRVIGVIAVYDKEKGAFSEVDLGALLSRADQAGVAIENVLLHQEAHRLAITDGLTSIWNHRYFQLQFDQELDRATRFGRPFSLILFDIDNFKTVNDRFGHQVGDRVLTEVARRVTSVIRDADMFARYGGEEFVLILPETDAEGGRRTAERIRRVISDEPVRVDDAQGAFVITCSIGVVCYPQSGVDRTTLFEAADRAMYKAKSLGKNQVVFAELQDGRSE